MRGAVANGKEVLSARLARGFTQEQLAAIAAVDVKTIRKAERGNRLDLATLTRLAYALQTNLERILVFKPSETELQLRRREAVMRWLRAWDERDADALLATFHDDGIMRWPGGPNIPFGGTYRGKDEICKGIEVAWSNCQTEPDRMGNISLLASDGAVIVNGKKGISLPNGEIAYLKCVMIFQFRGQLIIDQQVECDTLELARLLKFL